MTAVGTTMTVPEDGASPTMERGGIPAAAGEGRGPDAAGTRSIGDRWRTVPRRWRVVIVLLVLVAGLDTVVSLAGSVGGGSAASGRSSSFDPTAQGSEAMFDLVGRFGHHVSQLEQSLDTAALPAGDTLVVADPTSWDATQSDAVASFVRAGGRAVLAGGPLDASDLRTILGRRDVPVFSPVGMSQAHAVGDAPEVAGVSVVDAEPSDGAFDEPGATAPVLQGEGATLAVVADVGSGRVVLLASASPLRNQYLGSADNAAFALDVVGPAARPVVFDEFAHGVGSGGLASLPARWKWALFLAAVAALAWVWSASRRFGPPGDDVRVLAPARIGYVDGLAAVLAATDEERVGHAVAPLGRATRAALCAYVGVPEDTPDAAVVEAARGVGLTDETVRAALVPPTDRASAVATAKLHAWLARERRSHP